MGNRPINRRPWRRKPWSKKLKPGEKGWINGASTNCGFVPLGGTYTCEAEDPDSSAGWHRMEIISGAELGEHEDNLKLMRLVGDILIVPHEGDPLMVTMRNARTLIRWGLIVVDADMSSGSEVIPFVNPAQMTENADRSWLWTRTDYIDPHNGTADGGTDLADFTVERIDLDVRVQRRLKADQRLIMMATVVNTGILPEDIPNAEPVAIAMNLRAFIAF